MTNDRDDVEGIRPNAKRMAAREKPRVKKDAREWLGTLWSYTLGSVPDAFGINGPDAQVRGSLILIAWSISTSMFTGLVTAVFVILWLATLSVGFFRWSKPGSWLESRSPTNKRYRRRNGGE